MSKLTIKKKAKKRKIKVPYDAELNDLREWQNNLYNPGHYIGTGKLPYPLKTMLKRPKLKWAYLAIYLIPLIIGLVIALFFAEITWYQIIPGVIVISVIALIIWDSRRTINRKYKN